MDVSEKTWVVEAGGVVHTDLPEGSVVGRHRPKSLDELLADFDRARGDAPRPSDAELDAIIAEIKGSWE